MRPLKLLFAALVLAAVPAFAVSPPIDWRETVRAFNIAHCKHPAWGTSHSERDYRLAKAMAATDKIPLDDDVLSPAGKALMPARRDVLTKWLETLRGETDG